MLKDNNQSHQKFITEKEFKLMYTLLSIIPLQFSTRHNAWYGAEHMICVLQSMGSLKKCVPSASRYVMKLVREIKFHSGH